MELAQELARLGVEVAQVTDWNYIQTNPNGLYSTALKSIQ